MKRIIFSSKAKKDLKKIQYDTNKRNALAHVLAILANGGTLGVQTTPTKRQLQRMYGMPYKR